MAAAMKWLSLVLLLSACGSPTPTQTPTPASGELTVGEPTVADGVTTMEAVCFAEERCDALDSDCDGSIDESCTTAQPGQLSAGLAWSGHTSLALSITPDDHAQVDAPEPGDCAADNWARMERRSVPAQPGEYRIEVVRTDRCDDDAATHASVAVSVQGRLLGTYTLTVEGDRAEVVRFSLSE